MCQLIFFIFLLCLHICPESDKMCLLDRFEDQGCSPEVDYQNTHTGIYWLEMTNF